MEEYVKDCILTNEYTDLVLLRLVEITIYSIHNDRQVFPSLIQEPVFYRKNFRVWVSQALEEKRAMEEASEHAGVLDD
jgi:hypothetical protein